MKKIICTIVIVILVLIYIGSWIWYGFHINDVPSSRNISPEIETHYNNYGAVISQTIYYPKSDIMYSYMYDYNWDEENDVNKLSKITILKIYVSKECADVVANYILDEESTYEEE